MTAEEFTAWLARHNVGPVEAARLLGVAYQSIYNWSTRRKRVPKQVAILTAYIDAYGWPATALSPDQCKQFGIYPFKRAA
jgi:hypothetical protein